MFWSRKKQNEKLQQFDERLTRNAEVLAEDHNDLALLKVKFEAAMRAIQALQTRIKRLERAMADD